MEKYRQISYYTLFGIKKLIDLGDMAYGEWIIYDNSIPRYHISCFDGSNSGIVINNLLSNKKETIKSIINKINTTQGTALSFGKRPFFLEIVKSSELVELELIPLPEAWVKNL